MKYRIVVPLIQRDFAQGRNSQIDLRKSFIGKIKQTLGSDGEPLNLDFVYGYTEKAGNDEQVFVPLDGQQRLTTLWLLHWYLAPTGGGQEFLTRFTYKTRMSSKRFCESLVTHSLTTNDTIRLSDRIKDAAWFMASWSSDPTVTSMLNMIDTLQEEIPEKEEAWESLIKNRKITFDYIDIKADQFKLTDELYIKMNSRGKPLTPFEHFKARFSDLLLSKDTDYESRQRNYERTRVSYKEYFSIKIDGLWMDLFWKYRSRTDGKIDECILNFIYFISEFLYFKTTADAMSADVTYDFDLLEKVFLERENVDFLFDSLDFLARLPDINTFFTSLFTGLSSFDAHVNDYFLRAITKTGFEVRNKYILYAVLAYGVRTKSYAPDDGYRDFLRIVRNLLSAVRQSTESKPIEYTTDLRLPRASEHCRFIDGFIDTLLTRDKKSPYQILAENEFSGFTKDNIANEKTKATLLVANPGLKQSIHALEEHDEIQGNVSNFKLGSVDIIRKINAFLEIWADGIADSMIIRAFLASDDYSVLTGENAKLGEIWYFGSMGKWNRILTATAADEKKKVSASLDTFLINYLNAIGATTINRLEYLISNFRPASKDWQYYFVKYEIITNNPDRPLNLFTWLDDKGFEINSLGSASSRPLSSYHVNPYLVVLKARLNSNEKVSIQWGRFTDISFLQIAHKLDIRCVKKGWLLSNVEGYTLDHETIIAYDLIQSNGDYILKGTDEKDRIEVAFDFLKKFL